MDIKKLLKIAIVVGASVVAVKLIKDSETFKRAVEKVREVVEL